MVLCSWLFVVLIYKERATKAMLTQLRYNDGVSGQGQSEPLNTTAVPVAHMPGLYVANMPMPENV